MHNFRAALTNELLLLFYRKKTTAFLVFSAILPVLLVLSLHSLQPYLGLIAVSESFPVEMLGLYTSVWIPLFIFLAAADLFPNEISARTLKWALLHPVTRLQVYLSKAAALGIGIGVLLAILGIVTGICSFIAGSLGGGEDWVRNFTAYLAAYGSMLALSAVFIFTAQFFRTASGALMFSLLLFAAAKLMPFLIPAVSAFSPVSYTDWHVLWLSRAVSSSKIITSTLFLLSSLTLFLSLGYWMFERKEV